VAGRARRATLLDAFRTFSIQRIRRDLCGSCEEYRLAIVNPGLFCGNDGAVFWLSWGPDTKEEW